MSVLIKGFEDYYTINELGEVYSKYKKRLLKPSYDKQGYLVINLYVDGIRKQVKIHRLVALQFIPNPNNYTLIDHIDRNKQNNDVKNLRWTTYSVNNRNVETKSNHQNIFITRNMTYNVRLFLDRKEVYCKTFKTLDEALSERDCAYDLLGIENPNREV